MLLETSLSAGISYNLIANFGSCLIHLINYELLNLSPLPYPWILSNYVANKRQYKNGDLEMFFKDVNLPNLAMEAGSFSWSSYKVGWRRYTRKHKSFVGNLVTKMKWHCLAQFYLYPPSDRKANHLVDLFGLAVPEMFKDFSPKWAFYNRAKFFKDSVGEVFRGKNAEVRKLEITSRTAYRFMISDTKTEFASWSYWNLGMRPFLSRYPNTYLFHIVTQEFSRNISCVFLVCLYCSQHKFTRVESDIETIKDFTLLKALSRHLFLTQNKVKMKEQNAGVLGIYSYMYRTYEVLPADVILGEFFEQSKAPTFYKEVIQCLFSNISHHEKKVTIYGIECGGFKNLRNAHEIISVNGTKEFCERIDLKKGVG